MSETPEQIDKAQIFDLMLQQTKAMTLLGRTMPSQQKGLSRIAAGEIKEAFGSLEEAAGHLASYFAAVEELLKMLGQAIERAGANE